MYSYEINEILLKCNYNIDSDVYMYICNSSPQINHIKYDAWSNSFEMLDNQNNYWKFTVYKKD